jgi:hypothetical protein
MIELTLAANLFWHNKLELARGEREHPPLPCHGCSLPYVRLFLLRVEPLYLRVELEHLHGIERIYRASVPLGVFQEVKDRDLTVGEPGLGPSLQEVPAPNRAAAEDLVHPPPVPPIFPDFDPAQFALGNRPPDPPMNGFTTEFKVGKPAGPMAPDLGDLRTGAGEKPR